MILRPLLPPLNALLADPPQARFATLKFFAAPPRRALARRDDRTRPLSVDGLVAGARVVRPVGVDAPHRRPDLPEQAREHARVNGLLLGDQRRGDLVRRGIDREVELAPCAALSPSVHPHPPLALAEELQARRVDDEVAYLLGAAGREAKAEQASAARQRSVVGRRQREAEQPEEGAGETFCGPQRQVIDLSEHQAAEDGRVRVSAASPPARGAVVAKP